MLIPLLENIKYLSVSNAEYLLISLPNANGFISSLLFGSSFISLFFVSSSITNALFNPVLIPKIFYHSHILIMVSLLMISYSSSLIHLSPPISILKIPVSLY